MEQSFFSSQFSNHANIPYQSGDVSFLKEAATPSSKSTYDAFPSLMNKSKLFNSASQISKQCAYKREEPNNWAFIDMQNFHKGIQEKGWKIRWASFRQYLKETHQVTRAIGFLGYLREYENIYAKLSNAGFRLEFRRVMRLANGVIEGGNVDADLASFVMDHKLKYNQAVIVADDSDYCRTIQSLDRQNKLRTVISSHSMKNTSALIKQAIGRKKIISIESIKHLVQQPDAA